MTRRATEVRPPRPAALTLVGVVALLVQAGALAPALAAVRVPASAGALGTALRAAAEGDTLVLAAGIHRGPARIDRRIVLRGEPGAALDGGGEATVLEIAAPGTAVEDLEIRGSGRRALTIDSAIHVVLAGGVKLRRLRIHDTLYGIYAERAGSLDVEDCEMEGRVPPLAEDGEGNGIHLWYCVAPVLRRNHVERFVDGIYLSFVTDAAIDGNRLVNAGRYGLHTMYCQGSRLTRNLFARNVAGCAIMFSNHLLIERNDFFHNRGPRTYGVLLRDCSDGIFRDNRFVENTVAAFMDDSNRNRITGNLIQDNGWGIIMFSSCAGNEVAGNSFINDDYPVALDMRRTSNRFDDGRRGNYWSDNTPYDLNADGVSDVEYSPVSSFAFLSKQFPDLAVLAKSPAVLALGVAERVIPALRPSEVVDHAPLLSPVAAPGAGTALDRGGRPHRADGALAAFALLAAFGAAGLARGTRGA